MPSSNEHETVSRMHRKSIRSALRPNGAPAFSCLPGSINFIRADSIIIAYLLPFEEAEAVARSCPEKAQNEASPPAADERRPVRGSFPRLPVFSSFYIVYMY